MRPRPASQSKAQLSLLLTARRRVMSLRAPVTVEGRAVSAVTAANGSFPLAAMTGHHALWSAVGTMIALDCRS